MSLVDREKGRYGSTKIKQFQLDTVCHACGAANTVIACSGCGRLNNVVYTHCHYCGLALENLDDVEKISARDEIILDYDHRPLITETSSVLEYIAAMVRQVRERAGCMGLAHAQFVFKMAPELWENISSLYACSAPDRLAMPIEETWDRRAELRAKQSIFVDGVEYPVELVRDCRSDIFFMPQLGREPLPQRFLSAILRKVGKGGEHG